MPKKLKSQDRWRVSSINEVGSTFTKLFKERDAAERYYETLATYAHVRYVAMFHWSVSPEFLYKFVKERIFGQN